MPPPTPLSPSSSDVSLPAYIDRLRQYIHARLGPEYFASCAWRDYKLKLAQDAPGAPDDTLDSLKPFWMDRVLMEKGITPAEVEERSWSRLTGGWAEAATLRERLAAGEYTELFEARAGLDEARREPGVEMEAEETGLIKEEACDDVGFYSFTEFTE